ncbi:ATP-dependent DNA ligase [Cohnella fermenti]|uniref:ATP-dependent DNA ligase n=1 Tax=Cohnella fermenti TaxID=2565925 RepID=A0A4S4BZ54_9BACL|nr:ATP-dependent DNA ligase [Cohnella fermenti]THF79867.1 ATP-dependent DNA ligase [Cohnella fermenti]
MFVAPMRTGGLEAPLQNDNYIFEPQLDGQRLILSMEVGHVRLYSAHGFDLTSLYPELHLMPVADGEDVVLDAVLAVVDPATGRLDREQLARRYRLKKRMDIREASIRCPVHCFVFDILRYKGEDIRDWPLERRKALLDEALTDNRHYSRMPYLEGEGAALFETMGRSGLQGLVAKDKRSPYRSGTSEGWLTILHYRYLDVKIAGYRKNQFGWLVEHGAKWRDVVSESVPLPYRQAFYGVAKLIVTGEDKDFVYVRPEIEARLRYVKQLADGSPVQPEFVSFVV